MTRANPPHHGDGSEPKIEIKHEPTLDELLEYCHGDELRDGLAALIARERQDARRKERERCIDVYLDLLQEDRDSPVNLDIETLLPARIRALKDEELSL